MNDTRRPLMVKLYNRGVAYREIGQMFGVSRQRVHQILTGYKSHKKGITPITYAQLDAIERKLKGPKKHIWNPQNRASMGLPTESINKTGVSGGRDFIRELVRMRDKRTCQSCGKKWTAGMRRLDVHHLDEEMEGRSPERGNVKRDKESIDRMITLCHKCHLNLDTVRNKMRFRVAT